MRLCKHLIQNISEIFVVYQHKGYSRDNHLTLSWWRSLSYKNQSIAMDSFLYDRDLRHERVKLNKVLSNNNCLSYIYRIWLFPISNQNTYLRISMAAFTISYINPVNANPREWSNTLKQFVGYCPRIVWVCLTILWSWGLKG